MMIAGYGQQQTPQVVIEILENGWSVTVTEPPKPRPPGAEVAGLYKSMARILPDIYKNVGKATAKGADEAIEAWKTPEEPSASTGASLDHKIEEAFAYGQQLPTGPKTYVFIDKAKLMEFLAEVTEPKALPPPLPRGF